MRDKEIKFSGSANKELTILTEAIKEIANLALDAFETADTNAALNIEPLEEIIDRLKEKLRANHILRLQQGDCSIDAGFIWSDILTNLERTSDHCSNIAGCILETSHHNLNMHEGLRTVKSDNEDYKTKFSFYSDKYDISKISEV